MKKSSLGIWVRTRRKELGMTAEELARKSGVDRTYISKIEKHDYYPAPFVFNSIDTALNLGAECRKLYLRKKFPNISPDKLDNDRLFAKNDVHDLLSQWATETDGRGDEEFISRLLREFNPSNVENKKLIQKIIINLHKYRKLTKNIKKIRREERNLLRLINPK